MRACSGAGRCLAIARPCTQAAVVCARDQHAAWERQARHPVAKQCWTGSTCNATHQSSCGNAARGLGGSTARVYSMSTTSSADRCSASTHWASDPRRSVLLTRKSNGRCGCSSSRALMIWESPYRLMEAGTATAVSGTFKLAGSRVMRRIVTWASSVCCEAGAGGAALSPVACCMVFGWLDFVVNANVKALQCVCCTPKAQVRHQTPLKNTLRIRSFGTTPHPGLNTIPFDARVKCRTR